jgi:NAD(P)-dependent dehydrogenase (short-subunit alcohol dehydrogenase family)
MTIQLNGKVAVVTGSGQGLGRAYARALAQAGASVIINDVSEGAVQETVAGIKELGGQAEGVVVPVGSTEAADELVRRAVETFGRLDIMCTNAGILRDHVLWNMTDDDFDAVIQTHLRGTFTCARAAVRHLRTQNEGGRIIVVASIAGQRGNFGQTNYAAAKAGIAAFARTWAMECAKAQITVNAIVPNALTRMTATLPGLSTYAEAILRGEDVTLPSQLRKGAALGTAEDVAPLLVFLASERAKAITGQCIGIGGDKLSLWSHPQEIRAAYHDGGWTADTISEVWDSSVGQRLESYGIPSIEKK